MRSGVIGRTFATVLFAAAGAAPLLAQDTGFARIPLSSDFMAEGGCFADLDRDGDGDAVAGAYWYEGPEFAAKHELYPPVAFDPHGYSDHFFDFPYDFDRDGWMDVLMVGFPGKEARWLENPGEKVRAAGHWRSHLAWSVVDNESPTFTDLTGDGTPELVFHTGGRFGWASFDPADPDEPWTFHPLSADLGLGNFVHGLGVGDVNGDGRADVLERTGWWEQPASLAGDPLWTRHEFPFAAKPNHGGAQMFAHDFDGDGDADVLTSLNAHGYGLVWYEQERAADGSIGFTEHRIMGSTSEENAHGLRIMELHALALVDMNGDGLADLVTGKRWWAHGPDGDPDHGPAVIYWFELTRPGVRPAKGGPVEWIPHLIDADSGVGTQIHVGDANGDRKPDVLSVNKKGAVVLLQGVAAKPASGEVETGMVPVDASGRALDLDLERGDLSGWTLEGDAFAGQPVRGDTVASRGREPSLHAGEHWIGGYELHGDGRKGTLTSAPFRVTQPWASFLVGGGADEERVELLRLEKDGGRTLFFHTPGANFESMQRVVVDLSAELGREIVVRLVDEDTGGWGHINFDDFRLHATRPSFPRPSGVPAILPLDPVVHAGLAPGAAAAAMTLPEGFRAELVASEPELHQPIALTIDPQGRLWVVEAFTYPQRAPEGEGKDDILVFEDEDHDGSFETRTVFAKGLNLVSGLEVGFGGAWVGAAPFLYYIPDRNDDLVPDGPPEVLLDGWGYQDTHETLNAFTWGPDGWLYGCHGVFTHSRVGKPGTPDELRTPINAGVWRYHPTRHEFEVFAWGTSNPWGVDFDQHGRCFVSACVIPHLYQLTQGGRYLRQAGAHFDPYVFEDIDTIADHRHYLGDNPHGGNLRSNAAGGGHAHCGLLIYQADAFPSEWRGRLLMNNIHGNRTNADELERDGSGFTGRHAQDFLVANDRWFRGINLELSPEGSVYLIDWYDQQACHWTEPGVWDRTNGRLYRVSYGLHRPLKVDLTALASDELVRLLFHSNEWFARRARVCLAERGPDPEVHALLRRILLEKGDGQRSLRALWALHATGGFDERLAHECLASADEHVRAWTVQCVLEDRSVTGETLDDLALLAMRDPSPVVRLYLASALQRLPLEQRFGLARALVARGEDAPDANLPLLEWYGIEPLVAALPEQALVLAREARIEKLARFVYRRAAHEPALHARLVQAIAGERDPVQRALVLDEIVAAVRDQRGLRPPAGWAELYAELQRDADGRVRDQALELAIAFGDPGAFPALRGLVEDRAAGGERRARALEALVRGRDERTAAVLLGQLDEAELCARAVRGLAAFADPATPGALLERFPGFAAAERRDAIATLASRPGWARELLAAVGAGRVASAELSAFQLRALRAFGDAEVDRLLDRHVGLVRAADEGKEREIARVRELVLAKGARDLPRGREVFARTCQQCHALFGLGGTLGPDLTGANRADLEYLLSNVCDPSGVVGNEYRTTVARLADGRLVTGIERGRTPSSVTLQAETGSVTLALDEVEELELSPLSTMPDGLLDPLAPDEIRALFAYVQGTAQVPLLATPANVAGFFDGKTLAGWRGDPGVWSVEEGEIVGNTQGLERNSFLKSDYELGDFRLSLEVRLASDQGNSGIQFRTQELEAGDVAGYQADIGPGWWGKLYEEHGRELLADRGATRVVPDGWNRYVIECQGSRVRTWLNDEPCADLDDPAGARRGIVALQVHSGGPTEVRFRGLRLELLGESGAAHGSR